MGNIGSLLSHSKKNPSDLQILSLRQNLCQLVNIFRVLVLSGWEAKRSQAATHSPHTTKHQPTYSWDHPRQQPASCNWVFRGNVQSEYSQENYRIGLRIRTLGFNCVIKPYSNEPDALKGGGGRDSALSVLRHITDADRIIDLELTVPKRFRNVIFLNFFFFFPQVWYFP